MRLIDADALKKTRFPFDPDTEEGLLVSYRDVITAIDMAPTVVLTDLKDEAIE